MLVAPETTTALVRTTAWVLAAAVRAGITMKPEPHPSLLHRTLGRHLFQPGGHRAHTRLGPSTKMPGHAAASIAALAY